MWFNFFLMDDLPFLLVKVGRAFEKTTGSSTVRTLVLEAGYKGSTPFPWTN